MTDDNDDDNNNTDDRGPKQLRITSSGKIKAFVTCALKFFEKYDSRPLVLHTLPPEPPGHTKCNLRTATLVSPRLISVVEIIKREYLISLAKNHSTRLCGLHQYNEIGILEDLGYGESEYTARNRYEEIVYALQGKHFPKLKQTPYIRITLSLERIPELDGVATYQPPAFRKLSKSAKTRAKKRECKEKAVKEELK